jgi:predicted regulator of Ras-like GTPase activity (Roadblock/LC7/MglB family)
MVYKEQTFGLPAMAVSPPTKNSERVASSMSALSGIGERSKSNIARI